MTQVETGAQAAVVSKTDDYVLHSETVGGNADAPGGEQGQEVKKEPVTEEPKPKKPGGYQRQIHRLSTENEQLRQQLAQFQPKGGQQDGGADKNAAGKQAGGEPQIDDFENVLDYLKAHNKWANDEALKAHTSEQEKLRTEQAEAQVYEEKSADYESRVEANILKSVPDFYERAQALYEQGMVTPAIEKAVLDSPVGEMVTLYLMAHQNELAALAEASEAQVYRAVALIEARLMTGRQSAQSQGTGQRQTNASAPISPVKPSANTQKSIRDDLPYDEWKKLRDQSAH